MAVYLHSNSSGCHNCRSASEHPFFRRSGPRGWMGGTSSTAPGGESNSGLSVTRAQDMVTSMLSKGYMPGKDALSKAKSFDERHQFTATATSRVGSLKNKIGLADKLNAGVSAVNMHVQSVNDKYHIAERTTSVDSYSHEGVKYAGSAIDNNKLVQSWSVWVAGAFHKVVKVAGDVTYNIKGRMGPAEAPKLRAAA